MNAGDLQGQWTGFSHGDPEGEVLADFDFDEVQGKIVGQIHLFASRSDIPSAAANLNVSSVGDLGAIACTVFPFDAITGRLLDKLEVENRFPGTVFPSMIELELSEIDKDQFGFNWRSTTDTFGSGTLYKTIMPARSSVAPDQNISTWNDFKQWVGDKKFRNYIFRGQSKAYPLQTTFHRTGRKLLPRYLDQDIQFLHRSFSGRIKHVFDLNKPLELGAFMNLAQHHGFPTPLLDWTYSPFVAAWFAYSATQESTGDDEFVRVFVLNRLEMLRISQFQNLTYTVPHTSIIETLSIENDRSTPQQALLMLTNVQDVEKHVANLEGLTGSALLTAFDLPILDKEDALNDLAMMGITKATLMPGLDSICQDIKSRLF